MTQNHIEDQKGYWTADEKRGLHISVESREGTGAKIILSSDYWYRIQQFNIATLPAIAWKVVWEVVHGECGRTLVPTLSDDEEVKYYSIKNLNVKQVDQVYYLLKHALTKNNIQFEITHPLLRFASELEPLDPPMFGATALNQKRRRRRYRNHKKKNTVLLKEEKKV